MFPRNENRTEGTVAKTTLLRNRPFIGHFLRGRSLKGRCNICVYVPVCVPVCVPRLPPMTPPYCGAEQQNPPPHPHMTPHPRSRIRTRKQLRDLPLGRTTLLRNRPFMREIILSSEGAERNSLPPMTVPDPSPALDKNHPPMSP